MCAMHELYDWLYENDLNWSWLAGELDITPAAISQWSKVPLARVGQIRDITGIRPSKLRPDYADILQ